MTTVPLARNGGMTSWILVNKDKAPDERQILCSCESFYKRSLTSDISGTISDNIVHGIASIFFPIPCRRRGYAARMMRELGNVLYSWQTKDVPCVGTTLYSDIGKGYYSKLGWPCNKTNSHVELQPKANPWPATATEITEDDLESLCERDEAIVRSHMAVPTREVKTRFTINPYLNHMGWH
jgi:hypothetical protein